MKWKRARSPEDWREAMTQLAEANGCSYVEECLVVKNLLEGNSRLKTIVEPLTMRDKEMLLAKVKMLKQSDGESWAIGEVIERSIEALKIIDEGGI